MSDNGALAPTGPRNHDVCALPPQPSLEFERKRAKALLRELRDGKPEAIDRAGARHDVFRNGPPERVTLADAQLVIAREYGFASWPRLSRYIATLEREVGANRSLSLGQVDEYEREVQRLLSMQRAGWAWAAREIAAYVPRFYGASIADVLAATITIDDARVVAARKRHCSSWEQLLAHAAALRPRYEMDPWLRHTTPHATAVRAIRGHDLMALQVIARTHPDVLVPHDDDRRRGYDLMAVALDVEPRDGRPDARAITGWLATQGFDVQRSLNMALLHERYPWTVAQVQWLLRRGADPSWLPPSGIGALEHAIVSYWNGEAVDVLARHVTPRHALWVAAGVGDVPSVRRFFDRRGALVSAAYRDRPPLELMGIGLAIPTLPNPDQLEVLSETAVVAAINGRVEVMELLLDMGYPVDHRYWLDMPLIHFAIQHEMESVVELLVHRGTDLDLKVVGGQPTARQMAEAMLDSAPGPSDRALRIARLCGVAVPAPDNASGVQRTEYSVERALVLAGDDAARAGAAEVHDEHLLIGLLRISKEFALMPLANANVDLLRLRARIEDRMPPLDGHPTKPGAPLGHAVQEVIRRARIIAFEHGDGILSFSHLFSALLEHDTSFTAQLFVSLGGTLSKLRAEFAQVQEYRRPSE